MRTRTKRAAFVVLAILVVGIFFTARPVLHLTRTALSDTNELSRVPDGYADDASRRNQTAVAEVVSAPVSLPEAEELLVELIRRANRDSLRIAIAGARHSMGGHTIYPDGIVLDMTPFNRMAYDESTQILTVGSGALWADIIPYLNERGRSVAVMQSNSSFSVGGSISVNCHGWQHNSPPIASTVEAFALLTADGERVRCTRGENAELFSLAIGGYGLFGVIVQVELQTVPNQEYGVRRFIVPTSEYVGTFRAETADAEAIGMVFGRLSITPDNFLREAIMTVFEKRPNAAGAPCDLSPPRTAGIKRILFRGSEGSDYGKELRWKLEKRFGQHAFQNTVWRNQLLNEGVEVLANRSAETTDILHEYFIPPDRFESFLERVRIIVPDHGGDLLNVTVRNVYEDTDTLLRYADQEFFAFVMLFSQATTPEGDARMKAMTQDLIDAALELNGCYYLPYRLHASQEQFHRAYPQSDGFFERKRHYDPNEIFQNLFYVKYGATRP